MARGFLLYCATLYAAMAVSVDPDQYVKAAQPAERVSARHLAEAVQFRGLGSELWP